MKSAYKPPSFLKVFGWATARFPRDVLYIDVIPGLNILDFVYPWLQFSVFEDGRGVVSRVEGHGWQSRSVAAWEYEGGTPIGRFAHRPRHHVAQHHCRPLKSPRQLKSIRFWI